MNRDHVGTSIVALMLVFASPVQAESQSSPMLNTKAIEQTIGKSVEMKDEVYKVSLLRKDLSVALNGVPCITISSARCPGSCFSILKGKAMQARWLPRSKRPSVSRGRRWNRSLPVPPPWIAGPVFHAFPGE